MSCLVFFLSQSCYGAKFFIVCFFSRRGAKAQSFLSCVFFSLAKTLSRKGFYVVCFFSRRGAKSQRFVMLCVFSLAKTLRRKVFLQVVCFSCMFNLYVKHNNTPLFASLRLCEKLFTPNNPPLSLKLSEFRLGFYLLQLQRNFVHHHHRVLVFLIL